MLNIYFGFINIISFIVYYVDKRLAIKHKYRIPERVLIYLSVVGGSIGGYMSMMLFHHKTKHFKFMIINPIMIIIWIGIILNVNNII